MKFEIDPNELTTDQRAHVAAFITNWPHADEVDHAGEAELRRHNRLFGDGVAAVKYDPTTNVATPISNEEFYITEEQRLDAEQKSDLEEAVSEIGAAAAVNLNAIFGTPTEHTKVDSLVPLDAQGLPWDSRIHSSSKATIADGSWKLRRGVDPAEVEKVKAQLKELMAVPSFVSVDNYTSNEVVQALGGSPVPTIPDQVHNTGHIDIDPSSRIPAPIPGLAEVTGNVGIPTPPAPKSHYLIDQVPAAVTLTDLIGRMSAAITAGKLTQANIAEICSKHGVSEFHLLSNRPDLLPLIDADMKAMGV